MSDLEVPFAIDVGADLIVHSRSGVNGRKYVCPDPACGGEIILHIGRKPGYWHVPQWFVHQVACAGTGESVAHSSAKRFAAQLINEWRTGSPRPTFEHRRTPNLRHPLTCSTCADEFWAMATEPAIMEHRLPGGRIADVWCGFAVEVLHAHAVDDAKWAQYRDQKVACVEMLASDILTGRWIVQEWCGPYGERSHARVGQTPAQWRAELEAERIRKEAAEEARRRKALEAREEVERRAVAERAAAEEAERIEQARLAEYEKREQAAADARFRTESERAALRKHFDAILMDAEGNFRDPAAVMAEMAAYERATFPSTTPVFVEIR